jgi:hypothetical protein
MGLRSHGIILDRRPEATVGLCINYIQERRLWPAPGVHAT